MAESNRAPQSYSEAIEELVTWQGGEGITIYSVIDENQQVVRFVEVSRDFGDNTILRPFAMGSSKDFPFRCEIVLLSECDWERVEKGLMDLPAGWMREPLTIVFSPGETMTFQEPIVIDDKLRLVLFGLECALDAEFDPAEVERIFADAAETDSRPKHYLLYERLDLRVKCDVEHHEPETVWIRIESKKQFAPSLACIVERAGYQMYRRECSELNDATIKYR